MRIAGRDYDFFSRVHFFGILNLTPDSFSDGGLFLDPGHALDHALRMQEEGADFIDVGAESTRPGASEISSGEQILRLKKIIPALGLHLKIPVSLDTRHATVARWGADQGVALINDVSGLSFDPQMVDFLSFSKLPFILMHSRGTPQTMQALTGYQDVVFDINQFFKNKIQIIENKGIDISKIILDPGIGFAKTPDQNLEILARLREIALITPRSPLAPAGTTSRGGEQDFLPPYFQGGLRGDSVFPLLIGLSRKSFLQKTEVLERLNEWMNEFLNQEKRLSSQSFKTYLDANTPSPPLPTRPARGENPPSPTLPYDSGAPESQSDWFSLHPQALDAAPLSFPEPLSPFLHFLNS